MRIGILEDDPTLARELLELFGDRGHNCYLHHSGKSLLGFISRETVDVLLLDWTVQGMPAIDVVRRIRHDYPLYPPIVVLTPFAAEHEIIAALKSGVDGYGLKPLQPAVLLARIEALYERWYSAGPRSRIEEYGHYRFDTESETVAVRGTEIPLTSKEFALGLLLFRNRNRMLSRAYILDAVWGGNPEMQTRTVDSHVSKVRAKLDLRGENGFRLVPIYGSGYRLNTV